MLIWMLQSTLTNVVEHIIYLYMFYSLLIWHTMYGLHTLKIYTQSIPKIFSLLNRNSCINVGKLMQLMCTLIYISIHVYSCPHCVRTINIYTYTCMYNSTISILKYMQLSRKLYYRYINQCVLMGTDTLLNQCFRIN